MVLVIKFRLNLRPCFAKWHNCFLSLWNRDTFEFVRAILNRHQVDLLQRLLWPIVHESLVEKRMLFKLKQVGTVVPMEWLLVSTQDLQKATSLNQLFGILRCVPLPHASISIVNCGRALAGKTIRNFGFHFGCLVDF